MNEPLVKTTYSCGPYAEGFAEGLRLSTKNDIYDPNESVPPYEKNTFEWICYNDGVRDAMFISLTHSL